MKKNKDLESEKSARIGGDLNVDFYKIWVY